jgi:hypothetical protein
MIRAIVAPRDIADVMNPLASGDDDPFAEVVDDPAALSVVVVDVARMDERRKMIAAMREEYSQQVARLLARGNNSEFASNQAMETVLFGMDWVTAMETILFGMDWVTTAL